MKLYISADMEGLAGVHRWSDVDKSSRRYTRFQKELMEEVSIVCRAAISNKVQITVKDAHWTGKNILPNSLPKTVKLIQGWSGHPYSMMEYLDSKYDGVIFVGYHAPAGSSVNPLGHFVSTKAKRVILNGNNLSEFRINTYIAAQEGVPVLCVLGDKEICAEAKGLVKNVTTIETLSKRGCSLGNKDLIRQIGEAVTKSMKADIEMPRLPKVYNLEVQYNTQKDLLKALKHSGIVRKNKNTVTFTTTKLNDLLIAISAIF